MLRLPLKGRLVGVDKVGLLLGNGPGRVPQGAGMQQVIVVQQGDAPVAISKPLLVLPGISSFFSSF